MDLVWIVLLTIAFWKLVGRPVHDWLEGFRGLRFTRRTDAPPGAPPSPTRDEEA